MKKQLLLPYLKDRARKIWEGRFHENGLRDHLRTGVRFLVVLGVVILLIVIGANLDRALNRTKYDYMIAKTACGDRAIQVIDHRYLYQEYFTLTFICP